MRGFCKTAVDTFRGSAVSRRRQGLHDDAAVGVGNNSTKWQRELEAAKQKKK
jgi:hypothetical protein